MSKAKFGTAINCMDGRVQLPVMQWMKENYNVDYIDTVTEAGPDGILSHKLTKEIESVKSRVLISVEAHGSRIVAIVGHHDCAGNPVSKEEHWRHIKKAANVIRSWDLPVTVIGLWVNAQWQVEVVEIPESVS